jgi:flagellar biogenesis protein FliO
MRVVGRLPLELRRSVYLIEVRGRQFLVGVGEGPMSLLAELPPADGAPARLAATEESPATEPPPANERTGGQAHGDRSHGGGGLIVQAWRRVVGGGA